MSQAEVTAHLIDNILPQAEYRQFVVTFPYQLRYWMAMNSKLNNKIHKLVAGQIMNYYERGAEKRGIASPKAGGAHGGNIAGGGCGNGVVLALPR